jgi:hypothetical protein
MNFIKMLLIALGLVILGMLAFSVVGLLYSALWYLLFFGVLGIAGYSAYKWMSDGSAEKAKLESKAPVSIADFGDYKRALKEYTKRK